ncbi:hypothetical protein GL50803_0012905 [Giardia duodenalis]|uniref:Uncharacterized protein n=1 Tax=Giardia intestinalis (strain ATCC 50803 / WB clone C6) TaxID=184922 RepID=D3KI63_GIAIC|nr:hypothetical protein GL50803_0012905 [Giardia intestinalis]KAE8306030.1 hypothetical protein GL50803_0012905 [Giardia intestinalis]
MQERKSVDQHIVQTLTSKHLRYICSYTDPVLSMSISPHTSDPPGVLIRHQKRVSVNGVTLSSAASPYHVQWYTEQRLFLHSYKPGASTFTNVLQLIDIELDKTIDSIAITFNDTTSAPAEVTDCPCTTCSKDMQTFLVGGKTMQAIDIRTKKRLFVSNSAPVRALALYSKTPYSIFYLAGHQYLSLFTMDLRTQKEILLFPKATQTSAKLALEVCPHLESKTLLYTIQSDRLFTVVGHHARNNDNNNGLDTKSTASLMSRVAKHPSETFTWLHSILCYNNTLVSPYLVCSRTESRLALLNATSTESEHEGLDPLLCSNIASRNTSLRLGSAISRACSAAAARDVLAVAIDGGVYATSTF